MRRRDHIKLLLAGGIGGSVAISQSCKNESKPSTDLNEISHLYGRTAEEIAYDNQINAITFFTQAEMNAITVLADIVVPQDEISGSASQAGVPAFIEFMAKDKPKNQIPLRGGLKWLDHRCQKMFQKSFAECSQVQQIEIVEMIAYPDKAGKDVLPGVAFFNLFRNLCLTGFYTSEMGIKDIGYKGNTPNEWNGVGDEILKKHGLSYDARTLEISLKMEDRNTIVKWDEEGNIIG